MPPDPNVHVGVCAWVQRAEGLLMARRAGEGQFASDGYGTWTCPGGWIDFSDTSIEAAAEREAYEETGVVVTAYERMGTTFHDSYDGKFKIVTVFVRCQYVIGEPTVMEPDKCPEVRWVSMEELKTLPLFMPDQLWIDEHGV